MELTTLHVDTVMSQDGRPASGVHPDDNSPDDALATVGYVNSKLSGIGPVDVNLSSLQSKLTSLQTQLSNIQTTALTRSQYSALKDDLTREINAIAAGGDSSAAAALAGLQAQLAQANENINTLNQRNSSLNNTIATLTSEKSILENRITQLEANVGSMGGDTEQLQVYINRATAAEDEANRLRNQLGEVNTEISELNVTISSLREEIERLKQSGGQPSAPTSSRNIVYWGTVPSLSPTAEDILAIANFKEMAGLNNFEFEPGNEDDEGYCLIAYPTEICSASPTFTNRMNGFTQSPLASKTLEVNGKEYKLEIFEFSFDPLPFKLTSTGLDWDAPLPAYTEPAPQPQQPEPQQPSQDTGNSSSGGGSSTPGQTTVGGIEFI